MADPDATAQGADSRLISYGADEQSAGQSHFAFILKAMPFDAWVVVAMLGLMLLLGLSLWMHFGVSGGWLHAKLALVAALFAYFIWTGRWFKRVAAGAALPSPKALRWFNEIPLLLAIPVLVLVYLKPF